MTPFKINFLEHVAIRSINREQSAVWYEDVIGLERGLPPKNDREPILMMAGETGIAIFQAKVERKEVDWKRQGISHFAFQVSAADFLNAQQYFIKLDIKFEFQDHHHVHSIYLKDPDGNIVELTTPNHQ